MNQPLNEVQIAKALCLDALCQLNELKKARGEELVQPEPTFNRFRSLERINALTESYREQKAELVRAEEAKVEERRLAAKKERLANRYVVETQRTKLRKECLRETQAAQARQRIVGDPVICCRALGDLELFELEEFKAELDALNRSLVPRVKAIKAAEPPKPAPQPPKAVAPTIVVAKPAPVPALAKSGPEAEQKPVAKTEAPGNGKAHEEAVEEYKATLFALADKRGVSHRTLGQYSRYLLVLTKYELRLLTKSAREELDKLLADEAQAKADADAKEAKARAEAREAARDKIAAQEHFNARAKELASSYDRAYERLLELNPAGARKFAHPDPERLGQKNLPALTALRDKTVEALRKAVAFRKRNPEPTDDRAAV